MRDEILAQFLAHQSYSNNGISFHTWKKKKPTPQLTKNSFPYLNLRSHNIIQRYPQ